MKKCKNFNEKVLSYLLNNKKVSLEIREQYKNKAKGLQDAKTNKNMGRTS